MDLESIRGLERLLVIASGALAIYLGYRLFLHLPKRVEGEGRFDLPGGISIYISRVGPGVFFALFGTAVVGSSFYFPLVETRTVTTGPASVGGTAVTLQRSYFGSGLLPKDSQELESARLRVRGHIGFLNGMTQDVAASLPAAERQDLMSRLDNTKLELLRGVWAGWGDIDAFVDWVRLGAQGPPPTGLEAPAALFLYRLEGGAE